MELKDSKTLILKREDLRYCDRSLKINDINLSCFRYFIDMYSYDIYLFVDDDLSSKVIKSRYCSHGIIIDDNIMKYRKFKFFNWIKLYFKLIEK